MLYFLCCLAGVAVGALISSAIFIYLLERHSDRDLIERRMRAYLEYRERLGDVAEILNGASPDPMILRQARTNIRSLCREFRLTSWFLPTRERQAVGKIVDQLDRETRPLEGYQAGENAHAPLPANVSPQRILDHQRELERTLRRAVKNQMGEFRRFRFFPWLKTQRDETPAIDNKNPQADPGATIASDRERFAWQDKRSKSSAEKP